MWRLLGESPKKPGGAFQKQKERGRRRYQGVIPCLVFVFCSVSGGWAASPDAVSKANVNDRHGQSAIANVPDPAVLLQGGDNIGNATVIPSLPYNNTGSTAGYLDDYDESCSWASDSPDVVYSYTPSASGYLVIDLCASLYDTKVFVYENTVTPGTPFACNDDACGDDGFKSRVIQMPYSSGNTYYIVVDGYGGDAGTYSLAVTEGLAPPECAGDAVYSQYVAAPDESWAGRVSDVHASTNAYLRYDNFSGTGTIGGIRFWGLSGYYDGASWSECDEAPVSLFKSSSIKTMRAIPVPKLPHTICP